MVLRSRFWLGADAPEPVPEPVGLGLMQHAYTEFHYLSKFLPSLYIAENRETEDPPFPW
jgi:DAPG hydrolase PhiG domain